MSAEKEIVNFWLNKKGFFTTKNIRAKDNKYIGMLATMFHDGKLQDFWHVEVSCSISASVIDAKDISKAMKNHVDPRFNDKAVLKTIQDFIKTYGIDSFSYKKIFITSNLPLSRKKGIKKAFAEKEIELIEFEHILIDVISDLTTQYQKDTVIRTMQLIKYLLISKPRMLVELLGKKDSELLKHNRRNRFIESFLMQEETKKTLARESSREQVTKMLKYSSIKKPKTLAKIIVEDVLGDKSIRKFFNALFEQERVKKVFNKKEEKKTEDKRQKKLRSFFEAG